MKEQFGIREARAEDLQGVLMLERGVAEAPHWAEAEYAAMLGADANAMMQRRLLIAELYKDGAAELVGFAVGKVIGPGLDTMGELESVVVAGAARRYGIGKALCEAVMGWCASKGAREIEIEVRSGNTGARELYRRLGFVEEGLRRGYYRDPDDDAVLMRMGLVRE